MTTLLDLIGGEESLVPVLRNFHEKMVADPLTSPFFKGVNPERLAVKQRWFFSLLLGGHSDGVTYYLYESHKHLVHEHGLADVHFDRTLMHLNAALTDAGLDTSVVHEIMQLAEGVRNAVLCRLDPEPDTGIRLPTRPEA